MFKIITFKKPHVKVFLVDTALCEIESQIDLKFRNRLRCIEVRFFKIFQITLFCNNRKNYRCYADLGDFINYTELYSSSTTCRRSSKSLKQIYRAIIRLSKCFVQNHGHMLSSKHICCIQSLSIVSAGNILPMEWMQRGNSSTD